MLVLLVVVINSSGGDGPSEPAPPSSSALTFSPVTCWITFGPVMNMWALRVWMMKSVSAGLYAAPPAHGPQITEICGTAPDSFTLA